MSFIESASLKYSASGDSFRLQLFLTGAPSVHTCSGDNRVGIVVSRRPHPTPWHLDIDLRQAALLSLR